MTEIFGGKRSFSRLPSRLLFSLTFPLDIQGEVVKFFVDSRERATRPRTGGGRGFSKENRGPAGCSLTSCLSCAACSSRLMQKKKKKKKSSHTHQSSLGGVPLTANQICEEGSCLDAANKTPKLLVYGKTSGHTVNHLEWLSVGQSVLNYRRAYLRIGAAVHL
ncbi:unnamed protein product [Pleuronectes platessa]|uniref:Uncharacterized protein n=1 Tax=Pleuronectes platessa TaxID=8262 RepID=A0A9N7ZBK3_PLEPL|nr:unnamed protein product [Pleuronectes platessa]